MSPHRWSSPRRSCSRTHPTAGSASCPFPEPRRILGKCGCGGRRPGWNYVGYHLQPKVRSSWVPTSAQKLSPCHFLHSFNTCLLSVSQCGFAHVQMSFPDTHLPASMSLQLLLCVQNLGSFHTCPHLSTLCILIHWFIPATPFTLSALIHSCLYLSISVHTCVDWTHLFTPAHSCPHLSTFANIHAPCLC